MEFEDIWESVVQDQATKKDHPFTPESTTNFWHIQRDLNDLCKRDEMLWRDKDKMRMIKDGDSNTHFFHLSTVIHRRQPYTRILGSQNN